MVHCQSRIAQAIQSHCIAFRYVPADKTTKHPAALGFAVPAATHRVAVALQQKYTGSREISLGTSEIGLLPAQEQKLRSFQDQCPGFRTHTFQVPFGAAAVAHISKPAHCCLCMHRQQKQAMHACRLRRQTHNGRHKAIMQGADDACFLERWVHARNSKEGMRYVRNHCRQHDLMKERLTYWLDRCHWPQHYGGFQGQALGTACKLPPACHTESQPVQWQGDPL